MPKNILLLGEFSTGKSAFINMLLGVSLLPERVTSTDLPVIKISCGKPAGLWVREIGQKNLKAIDSWNEIPRDWSNFQFIEIMIPTHPLLKNNLVLWDTPGINSTNVHHTMHLESFLKEMRNSFNIIYFFIHGNITDSSIQFLRKNNNIWGKLHIVVNIKEIKPRDECLKILNEVRKTVWLKLDNNIPVELLYIGDICEEFNIKSEGLRGNLSDYELIKDWEKRRIDIESLFQQFSNSIIGSSIFHSIEELALSEDRFSNNEKDLFFLFTLAEKGDSFAQFSLGNYFMLQKESLVEKLEGIKWYLRAAENNNSEAQFKLGRCYEKGWVVSKDIQKALHWYCKAANNGHEIAVTKLNKLIKGKE